jgi:hypothetical protein
MSESLVLPLAAPLWDPNATSRFHDRVDRNLRDQIGRTGSSREAPSHRARAMRIRMHGTGYRAVIDDQPVSLINLSLSGVMVRGPMRVLPSQSILFKIGWPQDDQLCAAIGRVRWVRFERTRGQEEAAYRIGLAFETWDVRRLKEIMHHCRQTLAPSFEVA